MSTKLTIDWFAFIWWPFAIWLCVTGRVDWWVLALVVTSHINIKQTFSPR